MEPKVFVILAKGHNPQDDDRTVVALQDFRGHPLPGRTFLVSLGWSFAPPATEREVPDAS